MGTRLTNVKKIIMVYLKGRGQLTGKMIDKLADYYGLSIRRNSDLVPKIVMSHGASSRELLSRFPTRN